MRLPNKGKQCFISMFYEIEHTNNYIELLTNAEILCEYYCYSTISLCFKAPATFHNLRHFMEYRASKCWTLIG